MIREMKKRITIDLDQALLTAVDATAGLVLESRSQFIVKAVEARVDRVDRERVDAEFASMADDPQYCSEMLAIDREFSAASDAAWSRIDAAENAAAPARRPAPAARTRRGTR